MHSTLMRPSSLSDFDRERGELFNVDLTPASRSGGFEAGAVAGVPTCTAR